MLRRGSLALLCLALASALLIAQDTAARKRFEGTWEGKFKDQVFLTIIIKAGDDISGTISTGNIHVNDDGDLIDASPEPSGATLLIEHPKIAGTTLSFEVVDDGEAQKLQMTLTPIERPICTSSMHQRRSSRSISTGSDAIRREQRYLSTVFCSQGLRWPASRFKTRSYMC